MPVPGGGLLVMTMPGEITIEKFWVAFGAVPFDAVIVPVKVPAAVGVPAIAPALLKVSPSGKAPEVTAKLIGVLPEAVQVCE
jgi:hypothetical protein